MSRLLVLLTLGAMVGCSPASTGSSTSTPTPAPTVDPLVGTWQDRRLLDLDVELAKTVPIVFADAGDGRIAGTRPYTLHGESPCGTITIALRPASGGRPAAGTLEAEAQLMQSRLPDPLKAASYVYIGQTSYPDSCSYGGKPVVPTVVTYGPDAVMNWCIPAFDASPTCTAHLRRD